MRIDASFYDEIDWDYVRIRCEEKVSEEMLDKVLKEIENEKDKA